MKKILLHSYRGGSGKTIFSLNLSKKLVNQEKRVLLIETDFFMPSFYDIFDRQPQFYLNDFYEQNCDFNETILSYDDGFDVIFCSPTFSFSEKSFTSDYKHHSKVLKQLMTSLDKLKKNYDYCIIDSCPGFGFVQINNILLSDQIFLVIRAGESAFKGTLNMINNIYVNGFVYGQKINVVWNQIPSNAKSDEMITKWSESMKNKIMIEQIYRNYYSDEVATQLICGEHFFDDNSDFSKLLDLIIGDLEARK